jgi:phenylalanine-4-hydroxylase
MPKHTSYTSKIPGPDGLYHYDDEETGVWSELYTRQMANLDGFACRAYLEGQQKLGLTADAVPQVAHVEKRLRKLTGAGVVPVAALIPQADFSTLLRNRKFPVATFIRRREHIDYIEEPDIFHEVFGHCPMLADPHVCGFFERFGTLALSVDKRHIKRLFRAFWFSIEFGLIREDGQLKSFGAGIMSSPSEAAHAASGKADILPFDLLTVLRTPYRIDILQPVYFVIDSFEALVQALEVDVEAVLDRAEAMGDLPPRYDMAA